MSYRACPDDGRISLPEIISALSFALDLTEGAVHGHAVRSCLLGMRVAREAGIHPSEMFDLYYALLLKDIGCSSNAARLCQILGGDERVVKASVKTIDWTNRGAPRLSTLKMLWKTVLPEASAARRVAHILGMGRTQHENTVELISTRCHRGANIMRKLEFSERASDAVYSLDEHWDGCGAPHGLKGDAIPRLSCILAIAQHLDVFSTGESPQRAIDVLLSRSGKWFDPALVEATVSLHRRGVLWQCCLPTDPVEESRLAAVDLEPAASVYLRPEQIDQICEAFADVVDAKSPYTFRHSLGVADAAVRIAVGMDLPSGRVDFVRRAALLHDIGKLSVSNSILDKPGKLNRSEWEIVREHPAQTRRILERVSAFAELAVVASQHHEKLDGTGYPHGLTSKDLSLEARIVAVADVYAALSEKRPYREEVCPEKTMAIMQAMIPNQLDASCFDALEAQLCTATTIPAFPLPVASAGRAAAAFA